MQMAHKENHRAQSQQGTSRTTQTQRHRRQGPTYTHTNTTQGSAVGTAQQARQRKEHAQHKNGGGDAR